MAQLIGLFLVLGVIYPPLRQIVAGVGFALVLLAVLAIGVLLALFIYKLASKNRTSGQPASIQVAARSSDNSPSLSPLAVLTSGTTNQFIDQVRSIDWFQFEQLVALVYRKQGYAVARRGGANPDGGIDLIIEKNGTRTAVQCKHWKTRNVGVKAVREFLGALTDAGIAQGLFITLGGCTDEAARLADKHAIEVVNEMDLERMLEATDARFDPSALEILRDTRKRCPKCERDMLLRTASKGRGAGKQFWGCSGYPACRFTLPA